jgi:hypothetical protein
MLMRERMLNSRMNDHDPEPQSERGIRGPQRPARPGFGPGVSGDRDPTAGAPPGPQPRMRRGPV